MILESLEIEHFRQFRGTHRFEPQPNGVIGIIGTNGAGKTTLFEAIEWCLYQPTRIRSDELPPRGDSSLRPRVKLRLANPATGIIWEIERTLRKTSAVAEIIEIRPDGERTIIATGSSTVTAYNASRLIGLSHRAFVATFFTRQKELSFFGSFKPTERRREVGRLLGLETIRTAQEAIAEQRTAKRHVFQGLQLQYEHESGQRDFDAEREALIARLSEVDTLISERSTELIAAESSYRDAANKYSLLVEEREAALKLKAQRDGQELSIRQIDTDLERIARELTRISGLDKERPGIAELAATAGAIGTEVDSLEVQRERFELARSLREQRQAVIEERSRVITSVESLPAGSVYVRATRETDDLAWIDGLLAESDGVDSLVTEALLFDLQQMHTRQTAAEALAADIERFRNGVDRLTADAAVLEKDGPAEKQEANVLEQRDLAVRSRAALGSNVESMTAAIADLEAIVAHDHDTLGDSVCPTCLRTFSPDELEQSRAALLDRITTARARITESRSEIARLDDQIGALDIRLNQTRSIREDSLKIRERIQNGLAKIAETEQQRATLLDELTTLRAARAITTPVTEEDLARVRTQLERERGLERTRGMLEQNRASLVRLTARDAELSASLAEMGPIDFDPAQLAAARKRQDAARTALERLVHLDQQIGQKQNVLEQQETLVQQRASAVSQVADMDTRLATAPLDSSFIDRAEIDLDTANQRVKQVQAQLEQQRRSRQDINRDLDQIGADQKRLADVAARADVARVESDDLDHMYREFNAFEQYVARRVRPQLEDMTSELVRVITDNKYESIELDDDYGIRVWDGDLGTYPIEHFSGGEGDVISLSARLALSRLIGSQAANPPSFMVLDEVFGSLDRERRANVLDLLSNLAGSAESFQQLFVISHVDDVRLSPAFTEVWRASERADGSSQLENLNQTLGSEDL